MKKVIYFGAAGSGKSYCKHTQTLPDLFVDNDKEKWGKKIKNIEIKDPTIIKSIEIEYIVITSDSIESILPQILSYGIPREKIKVPPKAMIGEHPFEKENNRIESARILYELNQTFSKSKIITVGGTALGFARNRDFIKWDSDIDLFAPLKIKNLILDYLKEKRYKPFIESEKCIKGEFQLPTKDIIPFAIDLFDSDLQEYIDVYGNHSWKWPTKMFINCSNVFIHGFEMNIPNPIDKYLLGIYGKDWAKPRPDFSYFDYGK